MWLMRFKAVLSLFGNFINKCHYDNMKKWLDY
jgi:hypothetical protein